MTNLRSTKTLENLKTAFAGESQACIKYLIYASKAKDDGYVQLSNIFLETAHNEKAHAKIWFKYLSDGDIPNTWMNLEDSLNSEHDEWDKMYRQFAEDAEKEGFYEIAYLFKYVAKIEKNHCERFRDLLNSVKNDTIFKKDEKVDWKCTNCGHSFKSFNAPMVCPVCKHPRAYFEERACNY
ncbi:MAG: rubrerythrin family protein [Methanobacteriaceae archaeon]|nr:rubrerythrin family protein [Methanobacteriaceae archaeon]